MRGFKFFITIFLICILTAAGLLEFTRYIFEYASIFGWKHYLVGEIITWWCVWMLGIYLVIWLSWEKFLHK